MLENERFKREVATYNRLLKADLDLYLGPVRKKHSYGCLREVKFDKSIADKCMTWEEYLKYMEEKPMADA